MARRARAQRAPETWRPARQDGAQVPASVQAQGWAQAQDSVRARAPAPGALGLVLPGAVVWALAGVVPVSTALALAQA